MAERLALPFPDVPRLLRRAREGGAYSRVSADRSPIGRFIDLWRAFEVLAQGAQRDLNGILESELTHLAGSPRLAVAAMGSAATRFTPATFAALVDDGIEGAKRDAVIQSLKAAAQRTARGSGDPRDARRLMRGLRNAAVHAKVMTTQPDMDLVFGSACGVLDAVVVGAYVRLFEVDSGQLTMAIGNAP